MKRGRVTRGTAAAAAAGRRTLRRKNVVRDEDDDDDDDEREEEERAEDDDGSEQDVGTSDNDDGDDNDDGGEEEEIATPRKKVARAAKTTAKKKVKQQQQLEENADDDDDDEEEEEEDDAEEEEDDENDDDDDDEEEEVDDDAPVASGASTRRTSDRKPTPKAAPRTSLTKRQAQLLDAKKKKKLLTPTKSRNRIHQSSGDDDDEENDDDDDDDDGSSDAAGSAGVGSSAAKRNKRASKADVRSTRDTASSAPTAMDVDDDDDDDGDGSSSAAATPDELTPSETKRADTSTASIDDSKSESGTAALAPAASPVRRKGISMSALMNNSPDPPPVAATAASATTASTVETPHQTLRDDLHSARSDHELLEILTGVCTRVIKDAKSPSRLVAVSILSAVREEPERFGHASVLKYLLRLLRSKHYVGMKDTAADSALKKPGSASSASAAAASAISVEMMDIPLPVLIANVLVQVLKDVTDWPLDSVKVFLDDSLYSRVWVDHELSQLFVRNVKTILQPAGDATTALDDRSGGALVQQRFHGAQVFHDMCDLIVNHIRARLSEMEKEKAGGGSGSSSAAIRNMILTLIDFASIPQARVLAAENMESWLQNPSVKGPTKELLNRVISLCKSTDAVDMRTVDVLLKMKLKSTMFQVKVETISQLVRQHRAYLRLALSVYIARERPNNMGKDIDNMKMIQQIFRAARAAPPTSSSTFNSSGADDVFYRTPALHQGAMASKELAHVFRELSSTPEMAPVLKTVARKILKQLTFEHVDIKSLCVGMLEHDGHWDTLTKFGDTRLIDYLSLVTGVIWLALLMRGAAVKSMQIQQSNTVGRQGAGPSALGTAMKLTGSQPIPRRSILPVGVQRAPKTGASRDGKVMPVGSGSGSSKVKAQVLPGATSAGSAAGSASGTASSAGAATLAAADGVKTVKGAVRAKEELLQAMAYVQREAVVCCRAVLEHFALRGSSSSEKVLYDAVVKKLLYLEIPADVQPTDHDRVCFQSTREDIPIHSETLERLTALYIACPSVNRLEALRTLETMVFRAAEGQLAREALWRTHEADLASYVSQGGVVGIEVKSAAFIRDLLLLTKVEIDLKLEQEFCHSSRYWITCSILLIIGCFNPNTVGDYLWREFPTLRCLMQMVITGRYVFPPVDAQDPLLFGRHRVNFADLVAANAQLRDYEQQVLQHAQSAALFEDPPMVLELDGLARQPPPAILEHLHGLDLKFKLGTRLRQSRASDFLMEMVTGNDAWSSESASPESVWWIADIVCEDFATVQYLPHGCLCKLLLLAFRNTRMSGAAENSRATSQPALRAIVPRLLAKLRDYLAAASDTSGTASNIVLYYLDCLTSSDVHTRRVASQILQLLTSDTMCDSNNSGDDDAPLTTTDADDSAMTTTENEMKTLEASRAMSFAWLPALVQLPCYASIRERVFWSLESILERESSVESLTLCVKALHAFWKESIEADARAAAAESSDDGAAAATKQRNAALEQTLVLAGAFGKLLSMREFIATILLKQRDVYTIVLDVFWTAMKHQLSASPSLKSKMGVSFSDCKVFYVADGSSTVREIKLPLSVIHGVIHALCSPHACDADGVVSGVSSFSRLKLCLFPKATSSAAIISSTGIIATKDARLYPDALLLKLAASSPNAHLCASAVRAMKSETLWTLLLRAGLREQCLALVLQALGELARTSEDKAVAGLTTATQTQCVADAAHVVLGHLNALLGDANNSGGGRILAKPVADQLRRLHEWLSARAATQRTAGDTMDVDESADEKLLCAAFMATRVSRSVSRSSAASLSTMPAKTFYANVDPITPPPSSRSLEDAAIRRTQQQFARTDDVAAADRSGDQLRGEELHEFTTQYFPHAPARGPVSALFECRDASSNNSVSDDDVSRSTIGSVALALVNTIERTCPSTHSRMQEAAAVIDDATPELWSVRIALLHTLRASCQSSESAPQLAHALLAVVDHICHCASAAHRRECCALLQQTFASVQDALSYAASIAFMRHVVRVGATAALAELEDDPDVCSDVHAALLLLLESIAATLIQWKAAASGLPLGALAVQSLVVLVKNVLVLGRAIDDDNDNAKRAGVTAMDVLVRLVQDESSENVLVSVLNTVLTADTDFVALANVVALHSSVRREMIGVLYFQNPLVVAPLLDTLLPGWESLVSVAGDASALPPVVERRLVMYVDDALRDLSHDTSEAMDRFREIATRYPLLVLARFPKQLLELFGTLSLTQIYLNPALFRNILHAMDIVRPHMRAQPSLFATFCKFMFEVLEVLATHQASEFAQLVTRIVTIFHDALRTDVDSARAQLFEPERVVVLANIAVLYAAQPEIRLLSELVASRDSTSRLHAAVAALDTARNRHGSTAEQLREVEQFIARVNRADVSLDDVVASDADQICHVLDQLCASSQQQNATMPLLRRSAAPLAQLLAASNPTKATMNRVCHTLLNLMKTDAASIAVGVDAYVQCLHALRPGLRETAVAYVLEYLAFADHPQRRLILQQLFDDPSDIAKSKLVAYLKSSAFKSSLLPFARAAVEQHDAVRWP